MPELRQDPITGRWTIIAPNRAQRPNAFPSGIRPQNDGPCPFCEGNENLTPAEVFARRLPGTEPNRPGWRVRVVPNKYPALSPSGPWDLSGEAGFTAIPGVGVHEVIVESPRHVIMTSEVSLEEFRTVIHVYRQRLADVKQDPRLAYGLVFKNLGAAAGASLEHAHSQLIATPIVPPNVQEELRGAKAFYQRRGRCGFCEMIDREAASGLRVILQTTNFIAFAPFASRFPYETWVLPKKHSSHFETLANDMADELAEILKGILTKLESNLPQPAYNYLFHTAPFDTEELPHDHWHLEILPSLSRPAGFEWGTGCFINPVTPEDAAAMLRSE